MPGSTTPPARTGRTALLAAVAFLLPLALDLRGGRYIGSGDTVPAELLPIAVLEHGTLRFDPFVRPGEALPYWFRAKNGRVVSDYPVLPGLLNVPVFAAAKAAGMPLFENRFRLSLLTAALLVSFSTLFLFLALRRVCRSDLEAFFFSLLYFAATEVWSVAGKGLFQHGPSLFFLTLALWLLLEETAGSTAIAGLALGLAVTIRPTNLLITMPLAFFALRRRRGRAAFLLLLVLPVVLQAAHASRSWGDPFTLARNRVPAGFSGSAIDGLSGLLLSPSRGLLVFSPFLLFAVPAGVAAWRRGGSLIARCLVVSTLLTLAAFSRWRVWWGGHSFGYRMLIELVPLLVLLIAGFWPEVARSRAAVAAFGALAAVSVFVQGLGVAAYPSGFDENIDREPERLWAVRDSEISLLARRVFLDEPGPPSALPAAGEARPSRLPTPSPRWWSEAANNDALLASLDWPRPGSSPRGALRLSGWAGSPAGPVEVQILVSPGDRVLPVERGPRLDVCAGIPDLRDCSRIGFAAALPPPETPVEELLLVVELRGPAGSVRRLPPVRVFRRRD